MAIPQSKHWYEPRSIAHFEALEQTCRLRQLSGSGGKYFFPDSGAVKATVKAGSYCVHVLNLVHILCTLVQNVYTCVYIHVHVPKVVSKILKCSLFVQLSVCSNYPQVVKSRAFGQVWPNWLIF
jgi:hypothetical protein